MPVPDSRTATGCRAFMCVMYEVYIHRECVAAIILSPSCTHMHSDSPVYSYIGSVSFSLPHVSWYTLSSFALLSGETEVLF